MKRKSRKFMAIFLSLLMLMGIAPNVYAETPEAELPAEEISLSAPEGQTEEENNDSLLSEPSTLDGQETSESDEKNVEETKDVNNNAADDKESSCEDSSIKTTSQVTQENPVLSEPSGEGEETSGTASEPGADGVSVDSSANPELPSVEVTEDSEKISDKDIQEFKIIETEVSERDGEFYVTIQTVDETYDRIYIGSKEDTEKTPAIKGIKKVLGGYTFQFPVEKEQIGQKITLVPGVEADDFWYTDEDVYCEIPDLELDAENEDDPLMSFLMVDEIVELSDETDTGITAVYASDEENAGNAFSMFKIAKSTAKVNGENIDISLSVSPASSGNFTYNAIYIGSKDDETKEPLIMGVIDTEANLMQYTFSLPLSAQGTQVSFVPRKANGSFYESKNLVLVIPDLSGSNPTPPVETETPTQTSDIKVLKVEDGTEFSMFKISESTVTVKGDIIEVFISTNNTSFDKLYLGSKDDEQKQPVIAGTEKSNDGWDFTFTVPLEKKGTSIPICLGKKDGTWYLSKDLVITIPNVETSTNPEPEPDPEPSGTPEDGIYKTTAETGVAMFKVVDVKLTVKDGKMSAVITLSGTGYDYLYMGTGEEAEAASQSAWIPVKDSVTYKDENGTEKTGYSYEIPVSELDKPINVASHSQKNDLWYSRTITISSANLEKIKDTANIPENGIYETTAETGVDMFKVVGVKLTVKDGKMSAVITLSGTGYDYLYMGTGEEAEAASQSAWIPVKDSVTYKDENGAEKTGYSYEIPVSELDKPIKVASHSQKKDLWYSRTITISSANLKKIQDITSDNTPGDNTSGGNTPGGSAPDNSTSEGNTNVPLTPDTESKYETDLSGATSVVNSSTTLPDGVYTPDKFTWSGGTGRVSLSCSKVTVTNGQAYATIAFSSSSYSYVKANGRTYYGTISGGKSIFVIPVELNKNNQIIGMTTKMSASHEITYTIYVYLAAANADGVAGLSGSGNEKLDEEAPSIMGLEYQSETKLEHAQYFKIYHYDQGITLLEIDMTKDTALDPDRQEDRADSSSETVEEDNNKDETTPDEVVSNDNVGDEEIGEEIVQTDEEIAAELYKGNVVKYLLVPEDAEIPVGLDKEMIIVNLPVDETYVSSFDALETMNTLDLIENISAVGFEKEECELEDIVDAMEAEDIVFAGEYLDPDYKELVKVKSNLAILPSDILPMDEDSEDLEGEDELTVKEQTERMEKIAEKFAMLNIPMIVDRSSDEKTDLAKYEWIKVYGVLFGEEEKAVSLFDIAVKAAEEQN